MRYGNFVAPGNSLRVEVDFQSHRHRAVSKPSEWSATRSAVQPDRVQLFQPLRSNTGDAPIHKQLLQHTKTRWSVLHHGKVVIDQ